MSGLLSTVYYHFNDTRELYHRYSQHLLSSNSNIVFSSEFISSGSVPQKTRFWLPSQHSAGHFRSSISTWDSAENRGMWSRRTENYNVWRRTLHSPVLKILNTKQLSLKTKNALFVFFCLHFKYRKRESLPFKLANIQQEYWLSSFRLRHELFHLLVSSYSNAAYILSYLSTKTLTLGIRYRLQYILFAALSWA